MTISQQGVVTLLRSAITGEVLSVPQGFELADVMEMVRIHHMPTLVYEGAVRCGFDKGSPAMQQLLRSYFSAMMKSEKQVQAVKTLFQTFEENGIDYMPLKGSKMKFLYPKPELRIMNDADVLIRVEQYDRIKAIMESLGYGEKGESDHELKWINSALFLELHKRLIPSYNQDFYAYFGDGWRLALPERGTRYTMAPEDEMIYLFTHFAKHFRDGGIGCRHVVDLWVFLRSHPELDEEKICAALSRMQLSAFYGNIRRVMAVWFEGAPGDSKTDFLTDYIFASGSYGRMDTQVLSLAVRDSRKSGRAGEGKLRYFCSHMFPGVKTLRRKYTVLQRHPWMLPLVWLYRPFFKFFRERKDLQNHRERIRLINGERVDDQHKLLNYVGLDYNF